MKIIFPDIYTQIIYDYICRHDGDLILYKDLIQNHHMSYTTVRKKIKWLEDNRYIIKRGRYIQTIPQYD